MTFMTTTTTDRPSSPVRDSIHHYSSTSSPPRKLRPVRSSCPDLGRKRSKYDISWSATCSTPPESNASLSHYSYNSVSSCSSLTLLSLQSPLSTSSTNGRTRTLHRKKSSYDLHDDYIHAARVTTTSHTSITDDSARGDD
ncbi:hypothetical protein AMATHDRAFT_48080 [Amanita thiersii Skay4041]|uniref:Uncharacterized protein n=1 Tax=Amanita thiersii Skay4041 TaxID=703135 RepID=A0A2A9NPM1_9AGAR|nr:hypothetical protein AMATHDRAFT_48080 [Amanita thiersii Skay4041]